MEHVAREHGDDHPPQRAALLLLEEEAAQLTAIERLHGAEEEVARGAALEILFTTLLDPVSIFNKAMFLAALPFRRLRGWAVQNRADRGVAWWDAARLLWPRCFYSAC